ncbi:MAG: hypothetical protein ACYC64_18430 [Armatimonadota bacterium]
MTYLQSVTKQGLRSSIQPDGKLRLEPNWLITDDIRRMVCENRDELIQEIMASATATDVSQEIVPDYRFLIVATNLDSWEVDDPRFGHEVMLDTCYRQLDSTYYAWLRHCMGNARNAHDSGDLDQAAFNAMRDKFNIVHSWAVQHIGEQALIQAVRITNVSSYIPPSEATFAAYRKTWDDAWNQYLQHHATPVNAATSPNPLTQLNSLLSTRGYAAIRSNVLDDFVIIVRDDNVAAPTKWTAKVRFTVDEVNLLTDTSPEAIRRLCEIKQKFGGTVVPATGCPFKDNELGNERAAIQQSLFGTCA